MATPSENIATIQAYWAAMAQVPTNLPTVGAGGYGYDEIPNKFYYAARAMTELIDQSANNLYTRTNIFGGASMFETALLADIAGDWFRGWVLSAPDNTSSFAAKAMFQDSGGRSIRQIMLDGIYRAGSGGWFSPRTADGVTSWLHSVQVSGSGVLATIRADGDPNVVSAMLRILAELAIPQFWVTFLQDQRAFTTLDSRLATTQWSTNPDADYAARNALKALSAAAAGRVGAEYAASQTNALLTTIFKTGDGSDAPTVPPIAKKWWQQGGIWAGGVVGLIGGAAAVSKHSR